MSRYKTHNADGTLKRCKFCNQEVWWDVIECRWYEVYGEHLHECERSSKHYSDKAFETQEQIRQKRCDNPASYRDDIQELGLGYHGPKEKKK